MQVLNKQYITIADNILPGEGVRQDALLIGLGTLLIALCAQIEIPLQPVPITGQTFGVLFIAALLGANRGIITAISYLSLGAAGMPVFAGGATGITAFAGPTAGYLIGFIASAYLVGYLSELGLDKKFMTATLSMILGTLVIFLFGILGLVRFVGWDQVIQLGVYPFMPGAVIKITLAAGLLPLGRRFFSK